MSAEQITMEHVGAMPAPTWHFLNMNDTRVELPRVLTTGADVSASGSVVKLELTDAVLPAASDAFGQALAQAQASWEAEHPAPTAEEVAQRKQVLAAEADATYGGTAQSGYQSAADRLEESRSLAECFTTGLGDQVASYLAEVAGARYVVEAAAGQSACAQVVVKAVEGSASVAAIDVVAHARSAVSLSIVVDGQAGESLAGTVVRVFAGDDARVDIARVQTLGEEGLDLDDTGLFAAADARITIRQTVLGAGRTYTGLAGDLRGDRARVDVDTRYLGRGAQVLDFNYVLRHHGLKTECNLVANGVLAGKSEKTLRGTIDLIRGCKGSQGSENETVLLVDDGVRNKTVPIILCNEDDVAGNHGATIGHVRKEQLFYLASRGLSQEAAERMFMEAIVEQAALDAADDVAQRAVVQLGERMAPGFMEMFEDAAVA